MHQAQIVWDLKYAIKRIMNLNDQICLNYIDENNKQPSHSIIIINSCSTQRASYVGSRRYKPWYRLGRIKACRAKCVFPSHVPLTSPLFGPHSFIHSFIHWKDCYVDQLSTQVFVHKLNVALIPYTCMMYTQQPRFWRGFAMCAY